MKLIVDRDLPCVESAFGPLGEVRRAETAALTRADVKDADALVVRSTTKVDAKLLDGSGVRFVGTATIGTDHVDTQYLASRGIAFASAPGSNANSVKEYVVAALLELAAGKTWSLRGATIGVVGVGHVGSKVAEAAEALGMRVLRNDPPLARRTGDRRFVPLDELMDADVITLHVPLTKEGPDTTWHLFDEGRIGRMKKGAILINTSRGSVVRGEALGDALAAGTLGGSVLDVWENEPAIDVDLLRRVAIGTPHIAGYSVEGKTNAVRMVRDALCRHFGIEREWNPAEHRTEVEVAVPSGLPDEEAALRNIVAKSYDIALDDTMLRGIDGRPRELRGEFFTQLRAGYRERHEFASTIVRLPDRYAHLYDVISSLGFRNHQDMSNRKNIIQ